MSNVQCLFLDLLTPPFTPLLTCLAEGTLGRTQAGLPSLPVHLLLLSLFLACTGGCEQAGLPPLPAHLLRWGQGNSAALQVFGCQGRGRHAEGRRHQDPACHSSAYHPHQDRPEHT